MKTKVITIKTIEDILKAVNKDNVSLFLVDFKSWLEFRVAFKELKIEPVIMDIKNPNVFNWIDDGKNNVELKFEVVSGIECSYCKKLANKEISVTGAVHDPICPECGRRITPEEFYEEGKDETKT